MQRVLVDSTTLAPGGHNAAPATLELQFRSGALYRYFDVPHAVYQSLLGAPSKGAYFNQNIRGRYLYQRMRSTLDLARPSRPQPV